MTATHNKNLKAECRGRQRVSNMKQAHALDLRVWIFGIFKDPVALWGPTLWSLTQDLSEKADRTSSVRTL